MTDRIFSKYEMDVLKELLQGMERKQIARHLGKTENPWTTACRESRKKCSVISADERETGVKTGFRTGPWIIWPRLSG